MSMRSIGYSFNNAIADIIDNSITAEADLIKIQCLWNGEEPTIEIEDNGKGMDENELIEAMRPGTKSPLSTRSDDDLGRFGLGLKTASFSQCKKLIVKTYQGNLCNQATWDLDIVQKENKWVLDIEDSLENNDIKEKVTIIPITDNNKSNIFIDSCWIKNYNYNSNFFEIFIKVSNGGDFEIDNFPAFLFSDNKQITQCIINLKAQEDTIITMKFPAEKFNSKLYLQINDDSYQFDNKLFFSTDNIEKSKKQT